MTTFAEWATAIRNGLRAVAAQDAPARPAQTAPPPATHPAVTKPPPPANSGTCRLCDTGRGIIPIDHGAHRICAECAQDRPVAILPDSWRRKPEAAA